MVWHVETQWWSGATLHSTGGKAGAQDDGKGRVTFPRSLVEDAIAKAAKSFTLNGRDESRSIEVGGK
ncbi:trimethylamine methyltransferase family protein [Ahrensia sp. R2A130]|uniref:trimethylamine methyltransferase family protein n=1 Tax=Ahrensia sp. R2A130 TaxID=744979 RepID=UPI0001E0F10C|nr:trimethylamine methyltransferase family protein [Ahrensia sp. R2A130]EFL88049.1 trimethylamine methyltransferase MttB [Ahrensia sp. R2A130]